MSSLGHRPRIHGTQKPFALKARFTPLETTRRTKPQIGNPQISQTKNQSAKSGPRESVDHREITIESKIAVACVVLSAFLLEPAKSCSDPLGTADTTAEGNSFIPVLDISTAGMAKNRRLRIAHACPNRTYRTEGNEANKEHNADGPRNWGIPSFPLLSSVKTLVAASGRFSHR